MATRLPLVKIDGEAEEMPAGDAVPLAQGLAGGTPLIKKYTAITNSAGAWSVNYTGDFASVTSVIPVSESASGLLGQKIATLGTFDEGAANGWVVESNTISALLGGDGLQLTSGGIVVHITVIGIK